MSIDHERLMRRCLQLAVMARDQGNTPVGSVVVLWCSLRLRGQPVARR